MSVADIVFRCMESVTGIPLEELKDMGDLPLFENDIIDSLSLAELMTSIEIETNKKIDLKQINMTEFSTINQMVSVIEKI